MNYDDLKNLDELRRTGVISEEEYQREKEKFFNRAENSFFSKPLLGLTENSYIALMHISLLAGFILPGLGLAIPVTMWLLNKDNNPKVDSVGRHIVNFMISMLIYLAVSGILSCILIGVPMLISLSILYVVFVIIAAIKANSGESWKYPLTIDFLK